MSSQAYGQGLEWIDQRAQETMAVLTDWSNLNSGSRNIDGIARMHDKVLDFAAPLHAESGSQSVAPQTVVTDDGGLESQVLGNCLELKKRQAANRRILLTGHLDTVFPKDHAFQKAQLRSDGLLHGPGVADMKGGILVMLLALQAFEAFGARENLGWHVILNADEEIGSPGSARVLTEAAQQAHVGLVYEPALPDGTLAGARKGSGNFSLIVTGRAAHAGREHHLGRNAIIHISRLFVALDTLNGQHEGVTVNVGKVHGGGPVNVVPDRVVGHFNVRVPDESAMIWVQKKIDEIVEKHNAEDAYSVNLHGGFGRPPKPMTPKLQTLFGVLADCGRELGVPVHHTATGGCCDGNNLAAAGLTNIDTLGVRGAHIHSDQEVMYPESLAERAKLSYLLLCRIADGAWDQFI